MIRRILPVLLLLAPLALCEDIEALCKAGSASCGDCIKQHPSCGWCRDPHSKLSSRCHNMCTPPVTEMKVDPRAIALRSIDPRSNSPVQVYPQQVEVKIKEGESMDVPFKFLHKETSGGAQIKDFQIMTSNFSGTGVQVDFVIDCHGKKVSAKKCEKVPDGTELSVIAKVKLTACSSSTGSIPITVGAYGARSIGALYVSPLCGCECERFNQIEKNSPLCYSHGNLICGKCECQEGRGGHNCDCPLSLYNVNSDAELTDKCREYSGAPVCGGHGECKCGQCVCENPTTTGKFCSCENGVCPKGGPTNQTCFGHGVCQCGVCQCEEGWTREDCSCTTQTVTCIEGTRLCSDHGKCECGRCVCNDGWTGATCAAEEPTEGPRSKPGAPDRIPEEKPEAAGSDMHDLDNGLAQTTAAAQDAEDPAFDTPEAQEEPKVASAATSTIFLAFTATILRFI
ncbi:unnamed protein product, partial [Mesorhabditis spiculigera]